MVWECHPKFFSCGFQLQQLEEAQLQQREANLTALAAIGPRRKRPLEPADTQVSLVYDSIEMMNYKRENYIFNIAQFNW